MKKMPKSMFIPFRNYLLDEGYLGMCSGEVSLRAWKPKNKEVIIDCFLMNKPCIDIYIQFLKEYLAMGKEFILMYREEFDDSALGKVA